MREHRLIVDEPEEKGGTDQGPMPAELLAASLASCTAITMEMYAARKEWGLGTVEVAVDFTEATDGRPSHLRRPDHPRRRAQRGEPRPAADHRRQVPGAQGSEGPERRDPRLARVHRGRRGRGLTRGSRPQRPRLRGHRRQPRHRPRHRPDALRRGSGRASGRALRGAAHRGGGRVRGGGRDRGRPRRVAGRSTSRDPRRRTGSCARRTSRLGQLDVLVNNAGSRAVARPRRGSGRGLVRGMGAERDGADAADAGRGAGGCASAAGAGSSTSPALQASARPRRCRSIPWRRPPSSPSRGCSPTDTPRRAS